MRSACEKETIVNYNQEDSVASVYTWDKPLIRKLMKLLDSRDDIKLECGDDECATFIVPKSWVKIAPPKQMNLTDEQRAARAERMRNVAKK